MVHDDEDQWVNDNLDQVEHIGGGMQASLMLNRRSDVHREMMKGVEKRALILGAMRRLPIRRPLAIAPRRARRVALIPSMVVSVGEKMMV